MFVVYKKGKTYNLAAQSFNHEFYWSSLDPEKKSLETTSALFGAIARDFSNKSVAEAFIVDNSVYRQYRNYPVLFVNSGLDKRTLVKLTCL